LILGPSSRLLLASSSALRLADSAQFGHRSYRGWYGSVSAHRSYLFSLSKSASLAGHCWSNLPSTGCPHTCRYLSFQVHILLTGSTEVFSVIRFGGYGGLRSLEVARGSLRDWWVVKVVCKKEGYPLRCRTFISPNPWFAMVQSMFSHSDKQRYRHGAPGPQGRHRDKSHACQESASLRVED